MLAEEQYFIARLTEALGLYSRDEVELRIRNIPSLLAVAGVRQYSDLTCVGKFPPDFVDGIRCILDTTTPPNTVELRPLPRFKGLPVVILPKLKRPKPMVDVSLTQEEIGAIRFAASRVHESDGPATFEAVCSVIRKLDSYDVSVDIAALLHCVYTFDWNQLEREYRGLSNAAKGLFSSISGLSPAAFIQAWESPSLQNANALVEYLNEAAKIVEEIVKGER